MAEVPTLQTFFSNIEPQGFRVKASHHSLHLMIRAVRQADEFSNAPPGNLTALAGFHVCTCLYTILCTDVMADRTCCMDMVDDYFGTQCQQGFQDSLNKTITSSL